MRTPLALLALVAVSLPACPTAATSPTLRDESPAALERACQAGRGEDCAQLGFYGPEGGLAVNITEC